MGINQLGAFGIAPSPRAFFVNSNGGQQQQVQQTGGVFQFSLKSTQAVHVPAGNWLISAGQYSNVQEWDAQSYMWRLLNPFAQKMAMVASDGSNIQVVNTTGGVVGAVVTNRGTAIAASNNGFYGYNQNLQFVAIQGGVVNTTLTTATAPVAATTTGGALLNVFIGGSINTTVTVTNGGTGFIEAPNLIVVPPANQGGQPYIPATCIVNGFSGGVITSVTVINQGAGYVSAPTILVVPQEGDTVGSWATTVLTTALTNVGQLAAITVASPGTAAFSATPSITITGTTIPALAAASPIMNYSITAVALNAAGAAYGATQPTVTVAAPSVLFPTTTNTNPAIETNLIPYTLQPIIQAFSAAGGTMTAGSTPTVLYGGYGFYSLPQANVQSTLTIPTSYATWTVTAGGNTDSVFLYPI
jgi:hypothetical protein